MTLTETPQIVTGPYPIPPGRGRWRVTLHSRVFVGGGYGLAGSDWTATLRGVLLHARSRRLELAWNKPAAFTFTIDGRDPIAAQIHELATDVIAWRWDDYAGRDVCAFHGVIDAAEDQITTEQHTINFTAHDYSALLERRRITGSAPITYTNVTQDGIVEALVRDYGVNTTSPATAFSFLPGSWIPLFVVMVNPDGSRRTVAQQPRTRVYQPGSQISALIDDLANVINGYDYDVLPAAEAAARNYVGPSAGALPVGVDALRLFYPVQGTVRTDIALVYGGNVATVTRAVSSADYANRIHGLGNNGSTDPNATKMTSDQYNADASGTYAGLWADALNASDVSVQGTLDEQCRGQLQLEGNLVPTYSLGLRAGSYRFGFPSIGDVVPILIRSGRLAVEDDQQIVGIAYGIGDDGDETVTLTAGLPPTTFGGLFRTQRRAIDALNRR